MDLRGKTILITGAGRGLGAAMAKRLAARGANLALLDLDEPASSQFATPAAALGVRAETYSRQRGAPSATSSALSIASSRTSAASTAASPTPAFCATACSSKRRTAKSPAS